MTLDSLVDTTLSPPTGVEVTFARARSALCVVAVVPLPGPAQSLLVFGSRSGPGVTGSALPPLPPTQAVLMMSVSAATASVVITSALPPSSVVPTPTGYVPV